MELFADKSSHPSPLADRMRPRTLEEYVGQDHIVGPGRLLRRVIQADQLSSLIFYGPPGTGKTTLARVIAGSTKSHFITMNAVLSGVKQLREAIDEAKQKRDFYGQKTILFIDEVHRWNKAQQDALLPWVENGTVVLIGATTENPYFEVNSALVSRSRIFQLKSLGDEELFAIARMTIADKERGYGAYGVSFAPDALEHLVKVANGDARTLLNALELAVETTPEEFPPEPGTQIEISLQAAEESIQRKALLYDKEGDYHFDTISAFIKSVRGSDPDAVLYWLARMIRAGEDPRFIFRRMLISACEDIGLADPQALVVVEAAAAAFDRVGLPEGQFHLTQAALYLATAPKSNSALGYFDALAAIEDDPAAEVPNHLRDSNRDAKGFGHGQGYLYPHAYRDHWVAQHYLPSELGGRVFYSPGSLGHEGILRGDIARRKEEQLAAALEEPPEVLTFSPGDKSRERWAARAESGAAQFHRAIRETLFSAVPIQRHWRILDIAPGSGLFMSEALRQAPEGEVVVCAPDARKRAVLTHTASSLEEWEQPRFLEAGFPDGLEILPAEERRFELLVGRDIFLRSGSNAARRGLSGLVKGALQSRGWFLGSQIIPREATRLSELLAETQLDKALTERYREAEEQLYGKEAPETLAWGADDIERALEGSDFSLELFELREHRFKLRPTSETVENWFDPERRTAVKMVSEKLGEEPFDTIRRTAIGELPKREFEWRRGYLIFAANLRL